MSSTQTSLQVPLALHSMNIGPYPGICTGRNGVESNALSRPFLANKVRKLIEETKNGKVVSGMAQMIEFLKANGLAREAVIPASQVEVHMENRDGLGLNPMQTHSLLHDIVEVGFSFALTNPICIEMYGAEQTAMVEFNNRLAQQAKGLLPGFNWRGLIPMQVSGASMLG